MVQQKQQQKKVRPMLLSDKGETISPPHPTGRYDQRIENGHGGYVYMKAGRLHREDGPAVTWIDGTQMSYFEGKLHGVPAVIHPDGRTEDWNHGELLRADPPPMSPAAALMAEAGQ